MNFLLVDTVAVPRKAIHEPSQQLGPHPATAVRHDRRVVAAEPAATPDVFRSGAHIKPRGLTGTDRRWSPRTTLGKTGWIGAAHLEEPIICTVCNTSKHGAMLELDDPAALGRASEKPGSIFCLIWVTNRIRSEANCTVRWRDKRLLGVNFIGPIRTMVDRRG